MTPARQEQQPRPRRERHKTTPQTLQAARETRPLWKKQLAMLRGIKTRKTKI